MERDIYKLTLPEFPPLLQEINDPPEVLYIKGEYPEIENTFFLAVVGSRKYSRYGEAVTKFLIEGLRGYPVVIVSGLAMGIDTIAHKSAMENGLKTVAVPGSGLAKEVLYPRINQGVASRILEKGGALVSEFEPSFKATPWSFPQRNRVMAGLSHAVLVIEAGEKSGTLITARLASEYNRDVLVIPGSVFDEGSKGPHIFLKIGATPITSQEDLRSALGFHDEGARVTLFEDMDLSEDEMFILSLLDSPQDKEELIEQSGLPTHRVSSAISSLEIKGCVVERMGSLHRL